MSFIPLHWKIFGVLLLIVTAGTIYAQINTPGCMGNVPAVAHAAIGSVLSVRTVAQTTNTPFLTGMGLNADLETNIRVDCDRFERSFEYFLFERTVVAPDTLKQFLDFVKRAKVIKQTPAVDVRSKFWYHQDSLHIITVCKGRFDIVVNGRQIEKDTAFMRFLDAIIPPVGFKPEK